MKAVLIDPPYSMSDLYSDWDLSKLETQCPPLGLLYIASYLRKHKHQPFIFDVPALKISFAELIRKVLQLNPDIVGITSKTFNIYSADRIARELKKRKPGIPVVLGGAHVTAIPVDTMKKFTSFDYGIIGEGELTFLELIEALQKKAPVKNILGITWRSKKKVIVNPRRPFLQDLDQLPYPAWDLLPNFPEAYTHSALETKRLPSASIITSRGCPFQCTFCDRAIFGNKVRHHSAEYTLGMIDHLTKKYGIKDIMILDDNFLLDKSKLEKVCNGIISQHKDLTWYCLAHVKMMSEDRLEMIRKAGCWIIEVGIESGCDRVLQDIKKNSSKTEIRAAVERARKCGLRVKGNFIFGFPTDTVESIYETIDFACSIDISLFQQSFLTTWPGSELSKDAHLYGVVESDFLKMSHYKISYLPNGITRHDLLKASNYAFRKFYLRPKIILSTLATFSSIRGIQNGATYLKTFIVTLLRKG